MNNKIETTTSSSQENEVATTTAAATEPPSQNPPAVTRPHPTTILRELSFHLEAPADTILEQTDNDSLQFLESVDEDNIMRRRMLNRYRQQGVLWKRRDVFKNRWRPRWFVLHPTQGILTYYLLSAGDDNGGPVSSSSNHSLSLPPPSPNDTNRTRSLSECSENTVDYDVVPRGTIYLIGCTVAANESLSRPNEGLFAITITSQDSNITCHLAARTLESRDEWIDAIAGACNNFHDNSNNTDNANNLALTATAGTTTSSADTDLLLPPPTNIVTSSPSTTTTSSSPSSSPLSDPQQQENNGQQQMVTVPDLTTTGWKSMDESVYDNVPSHIVSRLQQILQNYLPMCAENYDNDGWHPLIQDQKDGLESYSRTIGNKAMIKSTTIIHHANVRQVSQLLLDLPTRKEYETNVKSDAKLHEYNSHASLDYISYNAVWPTSARDFAIAFHWQVLQKANNLQEKAALFVAFSCPQANELKPVPPYHVRGDLHVSLTLLRTVGANNNKCNMTRLLSYDLCGSIPRNLSATVLQQQSTMPRIIGNFMKRTYLSVLNGIGLDAQELSNEVILDDFKKRINSRKNDRRRITFEDHAPSSMEVVEAEPESEPTPTVENTTTTRNIFATEHDQNSIGDDSITTPVHTIESNPTRKKVDKFEEASLIMVLIILMVPVLVFYFTKNMYSQSPLVFVVSCYLAIRWVVKRQLGREILCTPQQLNATVSCPTTCRFTVDLKGVLRFIANHKEDGKTLLVTDIVVRALAVTLAEMDEIQSRYYSNKLLLLNGHFCNDIIDISVATSSSSSMMVTVPNADMLDVHEIAQFMSNVNPSTFTTTTTNASTSHYDGIPPKCVVYASPDSDHCQVDIDIMSPPKDVNVAVVVSGIRLQSCQKPFLSMSITLNCPLASVSTSRQFAEQVQKLMQFPEMLYDH